MPSVNIPFGEWLPDLPPIGLQGATVATNVIPEAASYIPFPAFSIITPAIGGRAQGGVIATDAANNNYNYAGNASALYALIQTSFSTVTRLAGPYTVATDDFWEFAQWGDTVIGVNGFVDLPQRISLGAANFADLSIGVKARHITTMRDFLVLGNVSDSATNVYRVRWSAINNPLSFTADAATLADYQDLPSEGGPVERVIGGEYGIIFQKRAIWRMQFVGSPLIFQFDRVHNAIGSYVPQGCVRYQNLVFFLAEDGFYSFDGSNLDPIGRGKVDRFFFEDLATNYAKRINAVIDAANKLVMWAYPSGSSPGGNCDKIIIYSWAYKRWTLVEGVNIQLFLLYISPGTTLDGLDAISTNLDTGIPASLDSYLWTGGQIAVAGFDSLNRLGSFNGSAMAATVESGEFQLFPDCRAMLRQIRPRVTGLSASLTVTVMNRNNLTESVSAGTVAASPNATGFVQTRVGARYFRIRMQTGASVNFTHLIGVEVEAAVEGVR